MDRLALQHNPVSEALTESDLDISSRKSSLPFVINVGSSEFEMKKMLRDCQNYINDLLRENKEISDRLMSYEKKMIDVISENQTLTKENKKLSLEKEHLQALNLKVQRELFEKDNILNVSLSPTKKNRSEIDDVFFNFIWKHVKEEKKEDEFVKQIADIEEALKKNEDYKIVLLKTREENKLLKNKLEMIENEKIQKKICFHCKDYYTPLLNTEFACHYHPGKLKYYSCRGCGRDEYYTCCNRCTICVKGCKEGKHHPME